jgi:chromosomal replication initiation ATPase DnaA
MIRYVAGRCPSGQAPVAEEPVVIPDFFAQPRITSAELRPLFEFAFADRLNIHRIQDEVARFYGLDATDIRMPDQKGARVRLISHARQMAMFMAREFTPLSLLAIGQRFGGRDHTTVIHAIRVVKKRAIDDPYVEVEIEVLRERFAA